MRAGGLTGRPARALVAATLVALIAAGDAGAGPVGGHVVVGGGINPFTSEEILVHIVSGPEPGGTIFYRRAGLDSPGFIELDCVAIDHRTEILQGGLLAGTEVTVHAVGASGLAEDGGRYRFSLLEYTGVVNDLAMIGLFPDTDTTCPPPDQGSDRFFPDQFLTLDLADQPAGSSTTRAGL